MTYFSHCFCFSVLYLVPIFSKLLVFFTAGVPRVLPLLSVLFVIGLLSFSSFGLSSLLPRVCLNFGLSLVRTSTVFVTRSIGIISASFSMSYSGLTRTI